MNISSSEPLPTAIPTPRQLEYQDWEFGLFVHFGIRTFYEGHNDFDGAPMPLDNFNPAQLDCDQWCRTARAAGCKYLVFTAKHHDGFCNWPSRYTDYSVASTPWRNGNGDLMREVADACARHGLKLGVYYSPADWKSPVYDDPAAYDEYFINQLSELLSGYGEIALLWLDGCGSENHTYNWSRIVRAIRRLQPDLLIFNMGNPDYRWAGNEDGFAPVPLWNTTQSVLGSILSEDAEILTSPQWLPAECDCRIRDSSWFYSDRDEDTVKSVDELMGMYYYSVGRGANLLLNIGPDRRGLLPSSDAGRLLEFGAEIRRRFSSPLARFGDFSRIEPGCWEFRPPAPVLVDHLVAQEDLTRGEHIRRFSIEIQTVNRQYVQVYEGQNVGHKAICSFPIVKAKAVRFRVNHATPDLEAAQLRDIELFRTSKAS